MKKFVDLNFVVHPTGNNIRYIINRYSESFYYLNFLKSKVDVEVIIHGEEAQETIEGIRYTSIKNTGSFWSRFTDTINYLKSTQPDYVLVQGLVFPMQVLWLKMVMPNSVKILTQHHGGVPFKNPIKRLLQKWADKYVTAYLFTAIDNAAIWVGQGVISNFGKCRQVLEASTHIEAPNKAESTKHTGISGNKVFLWVGRLDANKDPLTVLIAFNRYIQAGGDGKLYMIYQTDELLSSVQQLLNTNELLAHHVQLIGYVPHAALSYWYSAADYYVSGSHYEGSGYALIESMACGCVPIITAIPSFKVITKACKQGYLYAPGNDMELYDVFMSLPPTLAVDSREDVIAHFKKYLSFKAIADSIYKVCNSLG